MRDTERERERERQREKQASGREPNVGLDPGSPGSHPGLKAALNRCGTGAAPEFLLGKFCLQQILLIFVCLGIFLFCF